MCAAGQRAVAAPGWGWTDSSRTLRHPGRVGCPPTARSAVGGPGNPWDLREIVEYSQIRLLALRPAPTYCGMRTNREVYVV